MSSISTPSTMTPAQVAALMVEHGVVKHRTRIDIVFLKSVLAGVMLSFGGLLNLVITGGSPGLVASNPGLVRVLGGGVFPVGLVMIILLGLELLTSNMMVMPMAAIKRRIPIWSVPVNWIVVTFGNLVGSLFFAAVIVKYSGIISDAPYNTYVTKFVITKAVTPAWHEILLRGIGCNWLVCIAVWQAAGARETISKVIATWIPIWVFVSCGFDHVVANMFFIPMGILLHADLTTAEYIRKSLIASYIGNIIGALFVALPAVYFYLSDFNGSGLRGADEGDGNTQVTQINGNNGEDLEKGKRSD